jgi:hypothetical protein
VELYPELHLKKDLFYSERNKAHHRKFFDDFATSNNFDPLDAEKWYMVTGKEVANAVWISFSVPSLYNHSSYFLI